MPKNTNIAQFLFTRLHQLGVNGLHGVPGDYSLSALDFVEPAGMRWVSNCNELNAGYAADGYARVKGMGVIFTTFGVGELSAFNALAGAYAEHAPVVHIVGTPRRIAQESRANLHHTLGDGNFRAFADMYKRITVCQVNLTDASTAPAEIDRCLRECWIRCRPVYIELPMDMVHEEVGHALLDTPIDLTPPPNNPKVENAAVKQVVDAICASKNPAIIVDGLHNRQEVGSEVRDLVRTTKIPAFTTTFGMSRVNEDLPNYHGLYLGATSPASVREYISACDLIIRVGPLDSDVNTGGFTAVLPDDALRIDIEDHTSSFTRGGSRRGSRDQRDLSIKSVLEKLLHELGTQAWPGPPWNPKAAALPSMALRDQQSPGVDPSSPIRHAELWTRLSQLNYIRSNDIVIRGPGTISLGFRDTILPPGTQVISSAIWLSIGYMFAASQGAALAQKEMREAGEISGIGGGRTILFEGDGSFQMTAQEMSTIVRNKIELTMFLVNNDGYTVERSLHGMNAYYNDIARWRYLDAPRFFGANGDDPEYPVRTYQARTMGELEAIMADEEFAQGGKGSGLKMVEVFMGCDDVPLAAKDPLWLRGLPK